MLNYLKSERYRIRHSKEIYVFTGILAFLAVLINGVLWFFGQGNTYFPYNTTSFSFSVVVANPMIYTVMAFLVAAILYENDKKTGHLKNAIAFGISRVDILLGECFIAVTTALIPLAITLLAYIGSAQLLLPHTGPVTIKEVLLEGVAVSLIAVAALVSAIVLFHAFEKTISGLLVWYLLWYGVPQICAYLGFYLPFFRRIAYWFPKNFFANDSPYSVMKVNLHQCITIWSSDQGMLKCLLVGGVATIIASACGIVILKRKEI